MAGTVLWGPDTGSPEAVPSSINLPLPPPTDCIGGEYISIGAEVRIAGRSEVDLSGSCDDVAGLRFADCWRRLAELRAWKDDPESTPFFRRVELTGAGGADGCMPDPYFARNSAPCRFNVLVEVDWQDRDDDELNDDDNFSLTVDGTSLRFQSETANTRPDSTEIWVSDGSIDRTTAGGTPVPLSWSWRDTNATHTWGSTQCTNGNNTPCKGSAGNIPVHRTFLATDENATVVDLVRTSQSMQGPSGQPGLPIHSVEATGAPITVWPTVGLRSRLTAGQFRTLRAAGPQGNQSVDCEPTGGQGHDFQMFFGGCDPYYGYNDFDTQMWWLAQTPDACPRQNIIFDQPNTPGDPWLCVPAAPGFSASVIADGIAARTGNCDQIQSNSCSRTACNFPSRYPADPDLLWVPEPGDPRVVNLFVVPYGAFKGVNAQDGLPVTLFPKFYVTGWGGNGANRDPCPDDDPAQPGEIVGYFIERGNPGGPVDESRSCVPGSLRQCNAVLVR